MSYRSLAQIAFLHYPNFETHIPIIATTVSPNNGSRTPQDFEALRKRCDVYDNAMAVIYLTKRGQTDAAQQILDVFLRLLYPTDFTNIYPEEL